MVSSWNQEFSYKMWQTWVSTLSSSLLLSVSQVAWLIVLGGSIPSVIRLMITHVEPTIIVIQSAIFVLKAIAVGLILFGRLFVVFIGSSSTSKKTDERTASDQVMLFALRSITQSCRICSGWTMHICVAKISNGYNVCDTKDVTFDMIWYDGMCRDLYSSIPVQYAVILIYSLCRQCCCICYTNMRGMSHAQFVAEDARVNPVDRYLVDAEEGSLVRYVVLNHQ
jgi:hypothetical protein